MTYIAQKVIPIETVYQSVYNVYDREQREKIKHLKTKKVVKIEFENERFIIYTYRVNNVDISITFNGKALIEWSKEELKGVLTNGSKKK